MNLTLIGDVGSNWKRTNDKEKNLNIAFKQIEIAKEVGLDAVKFQLFTHKELYGFDGDDTYSLPTEWLPLLEAHARKFQIQFMCSAFSPEGVKLVDPHVTMHKIASAEFKYRDLWDAMFETGKFVIASTGSAQYQEISELLKIYSQHERICLMECVAAYPAEISDYRLFVLQRWRASYPELTLGISDHTLTNDIAILSIGLGATVLEKHFDGVKDQYDPTPDHAVSMPPKLMESWVQECRYRHTLTKDGLKRPFRSEDEMQLKHRRRLIATTKINRGDTLQKGVNFGIYRSKVEDRRGAPPEQIHLFQGMRVSKGIAQGVALWHDDLE